MKNLHSPRSNIRSLLTLQPEFLDEVSEDRVSQLLHDDHYWHRRIKRVFADAGIATRRLEREEAHPIWQAWLTRNSCDLAPDNKAAIKQLRKVLAEGGIKIERDEFNIIERRGDKLRCVFLLDLGTPGVAW